MSKLEKAWISYDLGNSAFATTVLAAFFPLFFPEFWGKDLTSVQSASYLLWTVALSNFLLFISCTNEQKPRPFSACGKLQSIVCIV